MKAIDLVCLIASPLVAGVLMTWAGTGTAVGVILLWNAAAWFPECYLLQLAQSRCSSLRCTPQNQKGGKTKRGKKKRKGNKGKSRNKTGSFVLPKEFRKDV
jgi:hypothetical protein